MKKITILFALIAVSIYGLKAQTNTPPLPNGNTKIGEHFHAGAGNEVWTDAANLYFNYQGNAVATYFWNKNGSTGSSVLSILNTGKVGVGTTTPLVPLQINAGSYTDNMTLGTATGGFSLTGTNGLFGLFSGVSSDGHVWMQVGRNDALTNTYPLTLQTQGGNVGIGTTNPQGRLQINSIRPILFNYNGSAGVYGSEIGFNAVLNTSVTPNQFKKLGGTSQQGGAAIVVDNWGSMYFQTYNAGTDNESTINYNPQIAFLNNGNVGIGTTTPSEKLAVNGGVSIEGTNSTSSVNGFNNALQLKNSSGAAIVFNPGQSTELMFGFHTDGNFYWGTGQNAGNSYCMFLSKTGNLGITGKLTTSEVNVKIGGWADFVFHPTYKLRTLGEVEQFIKANNHLPEIPTESEVKQNGIGLGEMNAKLLQKIEELTLYMIEQNNKMDQQQKQINELKELNNVLVKEVQNIKK
ncbi:MAG: hypothetical protein HOO91_00040 [Bacteroidales bacterium]|nr:hypothetical protein [Bacteroidales bacterium]